MDKMDLKGLEHLPILDGGSWLFTNDDHGPIRNIVEIVEVETTEIIPLLGEGILGPEYHLVYVLGLLLQGKKAKYGGEIEADECKDHRLVCCQGVSKSGTIYLPSVHPLNIEISKLDSYRVLEKIVDGRVI